MANILVYIELVDDSASWASLLALRQARFLATNVGATIYAVLPCATPPLYGENDIIAILSRQGADKVILMTHGDLTPPMVFRSHGEALITAANQFPPALLLLPEGPAAVEIAPRVAARLGGLFTRHPDLSLQEGSTVRIDQPLFEDTHVRRYDSAELEHSVVAVVSPDPQQFSRALGAEEAEVVVISPGFGDEETAARPTLVEGQQGSGRSQRMVLVGAGVGEAAETDAIRQLAQQLKADLRVTEGAADKGILEAPTLDEAPLICHPELVLAFGVHGSPETLARLSNVTYLVGVTPDEKAPLFRRAQLGLVAPTLETALQMVAAAEAQPDGPLLPVPAQEPTEPPREDAGEEKDDGLRDTLPPGSEAELTRTSAPTEEMETALADTAKESREGSKMLLETTAEAPELAPTLVPTTRRIDQLAHTPPMGTPMPMDLQAALAAQGAPTASEPNDAARGVPQAQSSDTPAPSDPASDNTPEATVTGVATEARDPALDDTVPAPLPGDGAKPSADASEDDEKGEQEP